MRAKRIGIVGVDGVPALQLTGPVDALRAATLDDGYGGRIQCYEICSIGLTSGSFRTDSGLLFTPEETLESAPSLDTIVIAGGDSWNQREQCDRVAEWLLRRSIETRRFASISTGVYPLAATGLLRGREVAIHWRYATELSRRFPALRVNHKKSLIKDGPFYSSSGVTAGLNLSLCLIDEDYGPHVARAVARELSLELPHADREENADPAHQTIDRFGEIVSWIVRHLHDDLSVEALARRACMSQDHFSKAFKSVFGTPPSEFVENLRLNEARRRLSVRSRTIDSVAASVGFASSDTFNKAFQRRFGVRPSAVLSDEAATNLRSVKVAGGRERAAA